MLFYRVGKKLRNQWTGSLGLGLGQFTVHATWSKSSIGQTSNTIYIHIGGRSICPVQPVLHCETRKLSSVVCVPLNAARLMAAVPSGGKEYMYILPRNSVRGPLKMPPRLPPKGEDTGDDSKDTTALPTSNERTCYTTVQQSGHRTSHRHLSRDEC